jgi:hypothetical protein
MWCIADLDAEYLRKMEDVLAVYEKPYAAAEPVICLDEKPVSLHADVRPPLPPRPAQVAKRDNEYKRCGTANVFCAVEPKAGRHFMRSLIRPGPLRSSDLAHPGGLISSPNLHRLAFFGAPAGAEPGDARRAAPFRRSGRRGHQKIVGPSPPPHPIASAAWPAFA